MKHLYGVKVGNPAEVASVLEGVLGHTLQLRDSGFYGDYWLAEFGETELRVVSQRDPSGELFEESFPDYRVLIYLDTDDQIGEFAGLATPGGVIELLR